MTLTDEEIRIKVAESLGWTHVKCYQRSESNKRHSEDTEPICIGSRPPTWGGGSCSVPNYPESLDACSEFEATLTEVEQFQYWAHLVTLCNEEAREQNNFQLVGIFYQITATPRQRCLAYLKTKRLIP